MHEKGYHIFGSVRNQADADKLSKIHPDRFTPLLFDVQNHDEVVRASKVVFEHCETLVGLINNAGIAIPGPLEHLSEQQFEKQLDVNVKSPAPAVVCKAATAAVSAETALNIFACILVLDILSPN